MEIGNEMVLDSESIDSIPNFYGFIKHSYFTNMTTFKAYDDMPFNIKSSLLNTKAEYMIKNCKIVYIRDKQNSKIIYAYAAYLRVDKTLLLHFIYVKKPFRGIGLAKKLIEHISHDCNKLQYTVLRDLKRYSLFKNFKLNISYV